MKTQNKRISFLIAAFMTISSFAAFANNDTDTVNTVTYEEEVMSDAELNEILFDLEDETGSWLNDTITYNIYDQNDNLVMTFEAQRTAPIANPEAVKLMAKSDLLMTYNDAVYYRLNKE